MNETGNAPTEVELKLEVRPADLPALMAHPLMRRLGRARAQVSTYYDTPDYRLRKAGLSLRLRSDGKKRVQTLKAVGDGLFTRGEWERPVSEDALDLEALRSTPLIKALDGSDVHALAPRFVVAVERRAHAFFRHEARIELTLDLGEARAGALGAPIAEIELELTRGSPDALFRLASSLFDAAPVRLSIRSKAAVGYGLLGQGLEAVKSARAPLGPEISTARAFQAIGRSCLAQFLNNERLIRERRSVDATHQARVAIRRLRAALSLFKPLFGDAESVRLQAALRRAGSSLGAARDLDVLTARLGALELPPSFDLQTLVTALERRREDAYDDAVIALEAPALAALLFDVAAWLEAGDWLTAPARAALRDRPAADFAREVLGRRTRKLCKAARKIRDLDPAGRHAVRIQAKKVRYGAEFFAPLAQGKKGRQAARRFIEALRPLQDALGELNDLVNAERQLRVLAEMSRDSNLAFAAGAAVDEVERGAGRLLRRAEKAAAAFGEAELFLA